MVELVSRKPFAEIAKCVICFRSLTILLVWTSQNSKFYNRHYHLVAGRPSPKFVRLKLLKNQLMLKTTKLSKTMLCCDINIANIFDPYFA